MKPFGTFLILLTTLALTGCQSLKFYEGPERPMSEVAEVYGMAGSGMSIVLYSINGKPVDFSYKKRVYLLPGAYDLGLRTGFSYRPMDKTQKGSYRGYYTLHIDAKPGMTYLFRASGRDSMVMESDAQACVFEEAQDNPHAEKNWSNEFRTPSFDAERLACGKVEVKKE